MIKLRNVRFHIRVRDDLIRLRKYIGVNAGPQVAHAYMSRLIAFCVRLRMGGQRGRRRPELGADIRSLSFERSTTVLFTVCEDTVEILVIVGRGLGDDQLARLLANRRSIEE